MTRPDRSLTDDDGQRRPLRRSAILEAAARIIEGDGIEVLSLRRLAADLGVTAPALYAHVTSRRDLLNGVNMLTVERLTDRYLQVDAVDPIDRIHAYSWVYVSFARTRPGLFDALFSLTPMPEPSTEPMGSAVTKSSPFRLTMEELHRARQAGLIRPDVDDVVACVLLWVAAHGVAVVSRMMTPMSDSQALALTRTTIGNTLRGLSPDVHADTIPASCESPGSQPSD
jgi:AcrR family transcriptional regulator